ncbi:hypothetical protein PF004_g5239 [Phytophthora fragariae]|uniref:ZSWIM1/3 RNaseH-like domain-containing protein n=1 Tax=Phytophthora fragariae TaxID=53985 RepID=A0A6G0PGC1_9STRA|nr:hypothetical protein PF004_g5239 [Phytophthora fragariae]
MRTKFTVVSAACEQCDLGHFEYSLLKAQRPLEPWLGTEEEEVEEDAEDENADVAEDAAEGEDDAEEDDAEEEEEDAGDVEEGGENCGSGSEKRKRVHSDEDIDLHYVPALKKHHRSWKAFDAYLKKYSDRTSTKMVVNETLNVSLRNRRIKAQKQYKGRPPAEIPQVPESVDPFQRVYICTHGWKVRSRSVGKRPTQRTFYTGCEARFLAQVYERLNGTWGVKIKRDFYGHNHHVSGEIFQSHPGIRQVPMGSPVMRDVELMVDCGGKASRIYDYIRSNTAHRVTMTDVYNMISRIKKGGSELSDEDQVAELLVNFNMSAEGNVSTVNENARGQTAVVSISSELMRKHYSRFPELLLVDCTHKTNQCVSSIQTHL